MDGLRPSTVDLFFLPKVSTQVRTHAARTLVLRVAPLGSTRVFEQTRLVLVDTMGASCPRPVTSLVGVMGAGKASTAQPHPREWNRAHGPA